MIPPKKLSHHASITQCGGKNLGLVIEIPRPPVQLEDPIRVSPVITSIASVEGEFQRREIPQLLDSVPGTFESLTNLLLNLQSLVEISAQSLHITHVFPQKDACGLLKRKP